MVKGRVFHLPFQWSGGKEKKTLRNYFCMTNLKGINVQYLNVLSIIRPIPHDPDLPVPEPDGNMEYSFDSEHSDMTVVAGDDT